MQRHKNAVMTISKSKVTKKPDFSEKRNLTGVLTKK